MASLFSSIYPASHHAETSRDAEEKEEEESAFSRKMALQFHSAYPASHHAKTSMHWLATACIARGTMTQHRKWRITVRCAAARKDGRPL